MEKHVFIQCQLISCVHSADGLFIKFVKWVRRGLNVARAGLYYPSRMFFTIGRVVIEFDIFDIFNFNVTLDLAFTLRAQLTLFSRVTEGLT
jgi:hypothetical protein